MDFVQPQDVLVTKSSMLFIAHPDPVAETMATVANATRRLGRMMIGFETQEAEKGGGTIIFDTRRPLKATR
jgi:hypothetical protein